MIQLHGINISVLETRQITQLSLQRNFVSDNLKANKGNLRKVWNLINELISRNSSKTSNILEIKADNKVVSNPIDIAETINEHFTNIAQVLAADIPAVEVNPEFYLKTTDKSFSLQTPSVDTVSGLLKKIDYKKAAGLDKISSTAIFSNSILTGIYPNE